MKQIKFAAIIVLSLTVALILTSCGDESPESAASAHKLSPEDQERINTEMTENLNTIAGVETDSSVLAGAMTGEALSDMTKGIETDLAQGKIKKRDYRNINIQFTEYNFPTAEVLVEFDDFSYYVDAGTEATLSQPTGARYRAAMAVVQEDGRWKIQGVYAPSTPETPRVLPQTTPTTPGVVAP